MIARHYLESVERFPKQDQLADGPGSLIHLVGSVLIEINDEWQAGRRCFSQASMRRPHEPLEALPALPNPIRRTLRVRGTNSLKIRSIEYVQRPCVAPDSTPLSKTYAIKASVSVMDFVTQYTELTAPRSGSIGLCPFHNDHHPGCGSGSVIDFWTRRKGCDFAAAVRELRTMV